MTTYRERMAICSLIDWTDHLNEHRIQPGQLVRTMAKVSRDIQGTDNDDLIEVTWLALVAIESHDSSFQDEVIEATNLFNLITTGR